jgi:hypothetical protein
MGKNRRGKEGDVRVCRLDKNVGRCFQWRFYVGAGGAQAPQMLARPPQIFGQLNFFLETGNKEIIELSILSHIACYLT